MTSRLDRLFVLLEAGAGPATRQAAARQLGEVQKAHPEELHRLLARLMKHLRSNAWETRVAASQAVEAILCHVPVWLPSPLECKEEEKIEDEVTQLRCETFDIEQVLQNGAHLMGSEGNEYDMEEEPLSPTDAKERLEKQRQQLNSRLGLDVAAKLGVDFTGFCTNEDLVIARPQTSKSEPLKRPIQELVSSISNKQMSSREMNLAKRRARLAFNKQKSRDCEEESSPEPDKKKPKLDVVEKLAVENLSVPDCTGEWAPSSRWPLQPWCSALQTQLFAGPWEWRHGASSALRQLLRAPVASTAILRQLDGQSLEEAHQEWLEDMALRLLCVLALDRFGDFVSDQVVAPVRETCAQTLGVALAQLKEDRVVKVAGLLGTLCRQPQWEARHGALLGFKYLLAARQELAGSSGALQQLMAGLGDACEDVSCCAAGALAPCAAAACVVRAAPALLARVCTLLYHQDDVAAPVQSYMALLAALMSLPEAAELIQPVDLTDILPRLWPYLDHPTTAVRKATLQALDTLTRPMKTRSNSVTSQHGGGKQNNDEKIKDTAENNDVESKNDEVNTLPWTFELLQHALRYVYQRILFERSAPLQRAACEVWQNLLRYSPLSMLLVCACPMLSAWLCLAMLPARTAADPALLLRPMRKERTRTKSGSGNVEPGPMSPPLQKWVVGGCDAAATMRARTLAATALGQLSCYLVQPAPGIEYKTEDESPIDCYVKVMVAYLRSSSALQRMVAALVVAAWAKYTKEYNIYPPRMNGDTTPIDQSHLAPPLLVSTLHTALIQSLYYDEVALNCNRVLQEARDLHAMMKHYKLAVDGEEFTNIIRLEQVMHLTAITTPMISAMKLKRVSQTLEERRKNLQTTVAQCVGDQTTLNISVQAALAAACSHLHCLPEKLNPVVRPLMESIKREEWQELQQSSADALAELLQQALSRDPCPNNKVLANLKTFLRCDPECTPRVNLTVTNEEGDGSGDSGSEIKTHGHKKNGPFLDKYNGILTLWEQQRHAEKSAPKRGRPPSVVADLTLEKMLANEDEAHKLLRIQRRGATFALRSLAKYFGDDLPEKLPKLWEFMNDPFSKDYTDEELESMDETTAEELISRFQVIETICECVSPSVRSKWLPNDGVKRRVSLLRARYTAVRHMCARALAATCRKPAPAHLTLHELITYLKDEAMVRCRCGACEALTLCVDTLQLECVPHAASLLLPLLGRMSDHCEAVRIMSTRCFATLVQIMPLEDVIPEPEGLTEEMRAKRDQDKKFLEQLFNPKTIKDYKIPVPVSTELRSYQQAGVNWLRFLHEYKLHGVLCDDMGLGKTLQSIVVVAGSHWEQKAAPPSLVICPPTLTGHWVFEVNKFIPSKFLKPLQYVGPPFERERLRTHVKYYNLIVASYDIVRKDIEFFRSIKWNYCVLDEGHVIKNGKTKAFKAIKQLVANHRLILSGTPIQNNVLELWSLFDFLMPGLLGSERQFAARYCRPILAAREPRAPPHAAQQAAEAAEALHRQVLPFLLRRTKEDVLKELPPKITQDYYCELSPLQRRLYERLAKEHVSAETLHSRTHVFQALHYLQNVCNHPKLVLTADHPEKEMVQRELAMQNSSLDDIEQSAKLPALKQLLLDCGIGVDNPDSDTIVSQHRALIFCQLKKMLDIVETDLLKKHLPKVSYLRLDGSVPAQQRHGIVTRFNQDVSYDLLLLTTAVGGLGVNLTGADTVIFVEHDWNPMKDLQAMDRAHRIGQRKVVNVYRLITRNTLEEKIMGLQKFKLMTANTVISSENAAIETMGTDKLLDLFQLSNEQSANQSATSSTGKSVLETLPELWDDKQYEEEYDMTNFIQSLKKIKS